MVRAPLAGRDSRGRELVITCGGFACGSMGVGRFRRGAGVVRSDRVAARAAFVALAAMMLVACTQSEVVTGPASAPRETSSGPADTRVSFSSFPASYFASSTFSPNASLAAPSSAALSLAAEPEASAVAGLRLASVTSTPVLFPPVKRTVEPKNASYGIASFYRHHTHTASGERFDERELTAAHRTLPFGTRVRVTSVATGRSVTVRVNDRGPYVPGRVVDLSYAAAEELGMVGRGVTKVKLDVVQ
jgi:rare lipoprotein A